MNCEPDDEPCELCGLCCKILGDGIAPTETNLLRWMEDGRTDILCHFTAFLEDGRQVRCSELTPSDLGGMVSAELRDPRTGELVTSCPFLHRTGRRRYVCSIHTTKPEMCINYRPWIFGETFFNRCKALNKSRPGSWANNAVKNRNEPGPGP